MSEDRTSENLLREWMLHRIAKELDVLPTEVDPNKKFEEFGIGSMSLVGIAGELAETIDRDLSVDLFFIYDNVNELAEHLGTSAQVAPGQEQHATTYIHRFRLTEDEDILQPLQPHGDRTPIFLVHGLTGNAAGPYRNVVAHLDDDQPVFGIRQPKNAGESIEELAALYIDAIRAVQRKGPFHIGGYCFGGMIAYEVARQLEQSGQATEQLTLFDPPPPRLLEKLALPARLGGWTRHIARSTTFLASQMIGGRPSAFRHAADATARALRKLKARIVPERHTRIDAATATHATHVQATVRRNLELLSKYYPGSYGGAVTLVLSSEPSSYRALAPEKWAQLNEAVHTAWVSTYHDDMLNSAGAKHVTAFLKRTSSTSPTARRRSG